MLKEEKHLWSNATFSASEKTLVEASTITEKTSDAPSIAVSNVSIGRASKDREAIYVQNLNFYCTPGSLTMILGKVASGKTATLLGLLQEYDLRRGSIDVSPKQVTIAYAPQDAYLQANLSIRENILFGSLFNADRYHQTIQACALDRDLAMMTESDSTLASGLSGGQRARVALARCVYADTALLLLDDVLNALDNKTEDLVWHRLFGPAGLLRGKTIIMITNSVKRFQEADSIVFLQNGSQANFGTYDQLKSIDLDFEAFLSNPDLDSAIRQSNSSKAADTSGQFSDDKSAITTSNVERNVQIDAEASIDTGHLVIPAIWAWIRLCNKTALIITVITNLLCELLLMPASTELY